VSWEIGEGTSYGSPNRAPFYTTPLGGATPARGLDQAMVADSVWVGRGPDRRTKWGPINPFLVNSMY
jgi:hypothetical protein